ncbi:hypothetical protein BpHYR1_025382 [Brachionus plicatilis]|uniref:Uncharacterized protein n=1 Tax=Brachionus plicatilis TaxID=10195 RepID=A0A3M7PLQ4_BRAPC|nr:hypothetical protein BpHYR1_025382 [Brachionus plicatilis]
MNEIYDLIQKQLKAIHLNSVKYELSKFEKKDGVHEVYSQWFKEVLPKCKENFEEYNKSMNFFEKVEKLHSMIRSSDQTDKPAWRFVDDSNKSIDSLLVNDKRRLVDSMDELCGKYDIIIKSLEKELDHKSQEFRSKLNKLVPKSD